MSNSNSLERQLLIQRGLSAWLTAWSPLCAHDDMKRHDSCNSTGISVGSNTMVREEITHIITEMVKKLLQEQA